MISKERLEELIEQGATVYYPIPYGANNIKLTKLYRVYDWNNELYLFVGDTNYCPLSILFETKEDAEWYKEFGCIERTERLDLPTWEEFNNQPEFYFDDYTLVKINDKILLKDGFEDYVYKEFTKENYILACRKCKELFLGGSDGDIR